MLRLSRVIQIACTLAAGVALSMCTQPYAAMFDEDVSNIIYIVIDPDSLSDLDTFFSEELPAVLSENLTVIAAVSGADTYRWRVNGDDPANTDVPHVTVTGEMNEELTIDREADDFTKYEDDKDDKPVGYPVGTTIDLTLLVEVNGTTYSANHGLVVE